ncbi:MAG: hypothetical protein P8R54_06970 [Myxococcota bacterium]|nr:hypothetical protein [Myxococcota bacterium]
MAWHFETRADDQTITPTTLLAVDIDPRMLRLRLGLAIRTGGDPELYSGAVIRRFFLVEHIHWPPLVTWLGGATAAALLARIAAGYTGTRLWSGDWTGEWTVDAIAALDDLHAALSTRAVPPTASRTTPGIAPRAPLPPRDS